MRVLVTGGAGFIGSHIVRHFQGRADVVVLDDLSTGQIGNLTGHDYTLIEGSIVDPDIVKKACQGVDFVFHMASMVSVAESMLHIQRCHQTNGQGLLNVLEASLGAKKVFFASSAAVYGNSGDGLKRETDCPAPVSPYAITKLAGEYYCDLFSQQRGLPTVSLRFFNVFGPGQSPHSAYAPVIPSFLAKALKGEPLQIHGDGLQTRDFIAVEDIVDAILFVTLSDGLQGVYNAGYGRSMTVLDLARKIIELTNSSSPLVHVDSRPGDVRMSCAATDKLLAAGWKPQAGLEDRLRQAVSWYQHQPL